MMQHIDCMLVEGVVWSQQGHHGQQGELVLVEECWGWERAGEQMYSWGWGSGVESLESLESGTAVERKNFNFTGCEA